VPVSLSYHASGIRVQETAGWAGLGWALNAGGVITRTVQGAPDEMGNNSQYQGWYRHYGNGWSPSTCAPLFDVANGWYDTEPDMFSFNVGGYTGKFFFNKDRVIQIVPRQDITIEVFNDTLAFQYFRGWILTDPQGTRYHFAATDPGMTMSDYVEKSAYSNDPFTTPKNSSWYLSKIESADRKDVIQFTYAEEKYAFWEVSTSPTDGGIISQANPGNCSGGSVRNPIIARIVGKRLSAITGTNGSIVFTGDSNVRTDLSNYNYCGSSGCTVNIEAQRLKTIEIRDKANACLRKFEFNHTYVISANPGSPSGYLSSNNDSTDLKRLVLLSVSEQECGTSANAKTHNFEYYDQTGLPRRLSFAQDHWGYNNGKTTNTNLDPGDSYKKTLCNGCQGIYAHVCTAPPNKREPAFPAMRNGTLKKITFPTGGSSTFDYEAHTIWTTDSSCTEATLNTMSAYGGSSCCYTSCSYSFSTLTRSFTQSQLDNGHIQTWIDQNCPSNWATMEVYTTYPGTPVASTGSGYCNLKKIGTYTLLAGVNYTFKLNQSGNAPANARIYTLTRTTFAANKIIGGLRIKSITTNDGDGDTANNIVKNFEYADPTAPTHSSGKLVHKPLYVGLFELGCVSSSQPGCSGMDCSAVPFTNENHYSVCPTTSGAVPQLRAVYSYSSLQPMQTTLGSHIGYIAVQVKETNNGKSEYRYNMGQYANSPWVPTGYPFTPPPYEPLLGTLLSEAHYTESGALVQSTLYEYLTASTNVVSGRDANKVYTSGSVITTQFYNLNTGYALPSRITEAQYDAAGNSVEKVSEIGYTPANGHLQKTNEDVTNSDGSVYRTKYKYAKDYPCPSSGACDETNGTANAEGKAIYAMRKRNMVAIPIEQTSWLKKTSWGASFRLTRATYFQFDKVNTDYNNLNLKAVHQVRPASPITTFVESTTSTSGVFSKDGNYTQEYNFVSSDSHGKILSQWKQNDPAKQQYIWGHNNKFPIAKVMNAESTEVAFTSFEQNDSASVHQGYWTFTGAGGGWNTSAGNFVSGRTGFNLSPARTITRTVPAGKYLVSGWHKDGSFVVNGTTVSTSTGGQWKYAEREVTLASPGNITVSSGGSDWSQFIDELRLCPADALMYTFSYDDRNHLLLSIVDENSMPVHYDYDNFQRLQVVRDQDRNILQTYEYNYQQAGVGMNEVKARTVLTSGQTTVSAVNALSGANIRRVFQCLDGLGRPLQTNEVGQSPTSNDIITINQYDAFGREAKKFIPYTYTTNGGAYRSSAATEQASFANIWGAGGYGYTETRFESSPLNRPLEQAAPGATWRIGNGHTSEYLYRNNTTADAVRDFTNGSTFAANLLYATQETDENETLKWTFTDKLGRVILVKQQLNATEYALTYTVYDDFGRIVCVIPPEATKRMISSGNWDYNHANYASMIFKYTYDSRGRMTGKTVPAGGTTTVAYDRLDRPVLSTDANGFKVFTRYDILSRAIVSGKYKGSSSPIGSDPLYEITNTTGPHYYTSTAFPTDNNLDVYKVLYYEDYDLDNNGSLGASETYTDPAESGYETAAFLRTRGKPTAMKTGILLNGGGAPTTFLTTRTYYDKEYSVIQINKQNHLGGADITSSTYDFANRITKTRRDHTDTPPGGSLNTHIVREEYVYDHAGRMRFIRHKINTNNWVVTTAPLYDELNRAADKRLHASNYDGTSAVTLSSSFNYLQSLDHIYNIRGWLTALNDPTNCSVQSGDQLADVFSMGLDYESTANGATPQYNGNIAAMQWRTNLGGTCLTRQQYRFSYDYANRLTAATHFTHNGTSWVSTGEYSESNISYDLNGNFKTYTRRGFLTAPSTYGNIDQLTYTYGDALRPDRLTQMADAASATKGFVYTAATATYQYDSNGNMTQAITKVLLLRTITSTCPKPLQKARA